MYGLLSAHSEEYRIGVLYREYPTLPVTEAGRVFRYTDISGTSAAAYIGFGVECGTLRRVIRTARELDWRERQYVLMDGDLWRIEEWRSERIGTGAPSMLRTGRVRFTISLMRVDNPTGLCR